MAETTLLWKVGLSGFGAALGVFFALVLAGSATARPHTRYLALFCLAFALTQVGDVAALGALGGAPRWTGQLGDAAFLLLAPMLHAYVWSFTEGRPLPGRLLAVALFPAAVAQAWLLWRVAAPPVELPADEDFMPAAYTWSFLAVCLVQLVGYAVLSWRRVVGHGRRLRAVWSAPDGVASVDLHWLRNLTLAASLAAVVWLVGLVVQHPAWRWLEAASPPLLVLLLGLQAHRQVAYIDPDGAFGPAKPFARTAVVSPGLRAAPDSPVPAMTAVGEADSSEAGDAGERAGRYARSGLSEARRRALAAQLDAFMHSERPFLEGDLTLQALAQRLGVPPHHCSQVLNQEIGMSFFDYINRWRVDEARRCLRDPTYASQTVLEIGLAAGFNSKAAFNASFKRLTGDTPTAYRRGG